MGRYQEKELNSENAKLLPKVGISGKFDENGKAKKGLNDDLMFTLTFNIGMWNKIHSKCIEGFDYNIIKIN